MSRLKRLLLAILTVVFISACALGSAGPETPATRNSLSIDADYQIKSAFDDTGIIAACSKESGVDVTMTYGSSTTLRVHNTQNAGYDAYWATSSIFLVNGRDQVYTAKSIVGIGTYDSVIQRLGWDPNNLRIQQVLDAARDGQIKWTMVNPSSGDPSSSFLLASYSKMVGETMLTQEGLARLPIDYLKDSYGTLLRAPDNIEVLKQEILEDRKTGANQYDTYVLYEANAIQINRELAKQNLETMKFLYVRDATAAGKFPLVFTGPDEAHPAYLNFSKCLIGDFSTKTLRENGYRTSQFGMSEPDADPGVFKSEWGINAGMADLPLIDYPRPDVTLNALDLFQKLLKPKQRSAMCFDQSGSMDGDGDRLLDQAAEIIFNQDTARLNGLSMAPDDAYAVFTFAGDVKFLGRVYGNDPASVTGMAALVKNDNLRASTAMFDCVREAIYFLTGKQSEFYPQFANVPVTDTAGNLQYDQAGKPLFIPDFPSYDPENYIYTIYVLTDGDTNAGWDYNNFEDYYTSLAENLKIKIVAVGFGDVRDVMEVPLAECNNIGKRCDPLPRMAELSGGLYLDGRSNLVETLKRALANY